MSDQRVSLRRSSIREVEEGRQHGCGQLDRHRVDPVEGLAFGQRVEHLTRPLPDERLEMDQVARCDRGLHGLPLRVIPWADEKVCQSELTALMSSYFVIDQYPPAVSISFRWTGSSRRNRSKYSDQRFSRKRCGLAGLTSSIRSSQAGAKSAPLSACSCSGVRNPGGTGRARSVVVSLI
jgi:hypothetical protein